MVSVVPEGRAGSFTCLFCRISTSVELLPCCVNLRMLWWVLRSRTCDLLKQPRILETRRNLYRPRTLCPVCVSDPLGGRNSVHSVYSPSRQSVWFVCVHMRVCTFVQFFFCLALQISHPTVVPPPTSSCLPCRDLHLVLHFSPTRAAFHFWAQLARFPRGVWLFLGKESSVGAVRELPAGMSISSR